MNHESAGHPDLQQLLQHSSPVQDAGMEAEADRQSNAPLGSRQPDQLDVNQKASARISHPGGQPGSTLRRQAGLSPEQRWLRIAQKAYAIARAHDFVGGKAAEDWLLAEEEVDREIAAQQPADLPHEPLRTSDSDVDHLVHGAPASSA